MADIKLGASALDGFYVGSTAVDKVYVGDVEIFSSAPPFDSGILQNGTFNDSTGVNIPSGGWSVSGGKLNYLTGGAKKVRLNLSTDMIVGNTYDITFTISNAGTARAAWYAGNQNELIEGNTNRSNGTYTISGYTHTVSDRGEVSIIGQSSGGGTTFSLDNISIVEVVPSDMSYFGSIVSGYDANSINQLDDTAVSTWTDSYGSNDGTSSNSALTRLKIVNTVKEVDFTGGLFDLGTFTGLDFIPDTDNFSIVVDMGSRQTTATDQSVLRKADLAGIKNQLSFTFDNGGGGTMRPAWGATTSFFGAFTNENVQIVTFDSTAGTVAEVKWYQNGVLQGTNDITSFSNTSNQAVNVGLGGRVIDGANSLDGSLRGVYIYDEVLDQTAVTNIQSFLRP